MLYDLQARKATFFWYLCLKLLDELGYFGTSSAEDQICRMECRLLNDCSYLKASNRFSQ